MYTADSKTVPLDFDAVKTQPVRADWLDDKHVSLDILRVDSIHPVISGNKWFKLQYYLHEAKAQGCIGLITLGGAWSNHIAATAYACKMFGLQSIGIIRGEEPCELSLTLQQAKSNGMQLIFVSRSDYRDKDLIKRTYHKTGYQWVPEGGFGDLGAKGAAGMLKHTDDLPKYSHIIAAVGTGTMLAGLRQAAKPNQQIIGISSMKGNNSLEENVSKLTAGARAPLRIIHDYHFGGYGKVTDELISFINSFYSDHQIPLDIVYTSKTMYAIKDMVQKNEFAPGSNLLMIHSGGLQGNQSLPPQLLAF